MTIELKKITKADLVTIWEISYGPKADLEWMNYNGPYFNDPILTKKEFVTGWATQIINHHRFKMIVVDEKVVGIVTAYWEDGKLKHWLEVGLVIYDRSMWGKGIGTKVLKEWLLYLFSEYPELPHLSFTTWSGNPGMEKIGKKSGMTREGIIRKVRYWQGIYYDSVKYGILREECCWIK